MTCGGVAAAVTGTGQKMIAAPAPSRAQGDVDSGADIRSSRRLPWLREHSVEHVALAVTIAKPTVYHCFRSREQILRSIHEEFIQLLTEQYLQRVSHGLGQ